MTTAVKQVQLPRVEEFRSDYTHEQIEAAEARNTRAIAMQAYLYAFPAFLHMRQLTEFIQGRQYFAPNECPLGGWVLMRDLSTPETTTVSPNVDTLYGASYLLLDRQGPVVLSVPPIPGRYYSVAIVDAYFNNFAIVSPRTFGNEGGEYLLVPPGWAGEPPKGIKSVFVAPTPSICLLQRIYTRDQGEYAELHALQDAIKLTPLDRWLEGKSGFPMLDLSDYAIQGLRLIRDPLEYFAHTNTYTGINLPPPEDGGLAALFQTVGVGPGSEVPSDPQARAAITEGAADAQSAINARITAGPVRNGWRVPYPQSGVPGGSVLMRATVQATQMGMFPLKEAIYFFAYRDAEGEALRGSGHYTLTFGKDALPPLREYGFWSLTMYGENSLLVENPLKRYILRPNSPGLTYAPDGSLTLYIEHQRPEGAPEGNWLPSPEGAFNVALRTYLPQEAIVKGDWFPPGIVRVG
jgi:hypothetical protein